MRLIVEGEDGYAGLTAIIDQGREFGEFQGIVFDYGLPRMPDPWSRLPSEDRSAIDARSDLREAWDPMDSGERIYVAGGDETRSMCWPPGPCRATGEPGPPSKRFGDAAPT